MDRKRGGLGPPELSSHGKRGTLGKYIMRQYVTLEILFVSFIFFNPNDKEYVGVVG